MLEECLCGLERLGAVGAEMQAVAVVEKNIRAFSLALGQAQAGVHIGKHLFGGDRQPVPGDDVPLHGGQAQFPCDVQNGPSAGSVWRAEVTDGCSCCLFNRLIATA